MSFNYKPKVIVKNIEPDKLYVQYEKFTNDITYKKFFSNFSEDIKQCQYCSNKIELGNNIFGIPVSIREINSKTIVEVCGNYCSFKCVNDDFIISDSGTSRKKNIKFTDSGPMIKLLTYKFYKSYKIKEDQEIDLDKFNMEFKYSLTNIVS
jgi:hypothetical protein